VLFLQGKPLKVHRARWRPSTSAAPPATIVSVVESLGIQTGDGVFEAVEIQPENKRRMTAAEFLAGSRLQPGATFDLPPAQA
jgi:methionyl-tRNA formyltransferase